MRQKNITIFKMVILYLLLLGTTALPLLFYRITQSYMGHLAGKMVTYLIMAGITYLFYKNKKHIFSDFGYSSKSVGKQIRIGIIAAFVTLSIFVLIPLILGMDKAAVLASKETDFVKIAGQIIFLMLFVGPIEEFIYRGYFQEQLGELIPNRMMVCLVTALLFGFSHFPSTLSMVNVVCTGTVGFIFSLFKTKSKDCTMFSVSLAHGLHDTTIFILSCILM